MSLLWFLYPDEAWCSGCKKCNQRAIELRQRLLEQQQREGIEPQGYDVSMTDWNNSSSAANDQAKDDKQDKKDKKKKKKKKKKDSSSSSSN
jgi:hypothetical protein